LRRLRFRYMRLHYQFVMANELRAAYDYFMMMCGPAPFRRTVTQPNGPADLYGVDGAYAESSHCGAAPTPTLPSSALALSSAASEDARSLDTAGDPLLGPT